MDSRNSLCAIQPNTADHLFAIQTLSASVNQVSRMVLIGQGTAALLALKGRVDREK